MIFVLLVSTAVASAAPGWSTPTRVAVTFQDVVGLPVDAAGVPRVVRTRVPDALAMLSVFGDDTTAVNARGDLAYVTSGSAPTLAVLPAGGVLQAGSVSTNAAIGLSDPGWRVALNDAGDAAVVWRGPKDDVRSIWRTAAGVVRSGTLSRTAARVRDHDVVIAPDGTMTAVWLQYSATHAAIVSTRRRPSDAGWSTPIAVAAVSVDAAPDPPGVDGGRPRHRDARVG